MSRRGSGSLERALAQWVAGGRGPVLVLTGAGISQESGIPTFRGSDGFWTVGSRNHHPQELATAAAFRAEPELVWRFYLERIRRHRGALPNAAHRALVALERRLGDGFLLVTQNVDGLHLRAGHTPSRVFHIHGDLGFVRCAEECGAPITALDPAVDTHEFGESGFTPALRELLTCPRCGGWRRPHVLWFDECYDEPNFHFESSLAAAVRAALLLVIGTSGTTNLPNQIVRTVLRRDRPILVIDAEPGPFTELRGTTFLQGAATTQVPAICLQIDRVDS